MIYPFADKLENLGSKYGLVVAAAKRAKQLKMGVHPTIETDSRNALTIALEEIAMGKIGYTCPDNDLIDVPTEEPEVAQLLAIPERSDEELEAGAATLEDETTLEIEGVDSADDEELLKEWEEGDDSEEDEVLPLDKHLENGIVIDPDADEDSDNESDILSVDEPKPKTRGRRKAQPEPDIDVDLDIDPEIEAEIDAEDIDIEEE